MPAATDRPESQLTLVNEAALAARIIRAANLTRIFFQWLSEPSRFEKVNSNLASSATEAAVDEILQPLRETANSVENRQTRYASSWLATICCHIMDRSKSLDLDIGPRLLASGLLPLYRSLATGNLGEGFAQARYRLSEVLALQAICDELGDDFVQSLKHAIQREQTPTEILQQRFDIDLVCLATLIRQLAIEFDPDAGTLSAAAVEALVGFEKTSPTPKIADWATPELLWRLAGELIAKKPKLLLPRPWVNTPVPWGSVGEHWRGLQDRLAARSPGISDQNSGLDRNFTATGLPEKATSANARIGDSPNANQTAGVEKPTRETHISAYTLKNASIESNQQDATNMSILTKIMIAEIRTYNDPVFVNVVRRQIATCRGEERAFSLASIIVRPEDDANQDAICGSLEDGLTLWQRKLVNWLADHPHIIEPHAFLTRKGELILSLRDIDRNEATSLLRHALVEVLTGAVIEEDLQNALAKVNVPARYHAGIASTSAPGLSFTPEKMIEAVVRCLSAACQHGKASIKSIEVF